MDISTFVDGEPVARWHTIPGTEVRVQIRIMKPRRRREMLRQCTRRRRRGGMAVDEVDNDRLLRMMLEYCVVDWKGIERNGQALPVTPENKRLLDDNWSEFAMLWNGVIGEEVALGDELDEEAAENLGSGQSTS